MALELAPLDAPVFELAPEEAVSDEADGDDCCETILAHDLDDAALVEAAAAEADVGTVDKAAPALEDDDEAELELVLFNAIEFVLL